MNQSHSRECNDRGEFDLQEAARAKTLAVNLFGGPASGKTTLAHRLCADLARAGVLVEYVPEYAKELVWLDQQELLDGSVSSQTVVICEQVNRMNVSLGKTEVIVTDSPVLMGLAYVDREDPHYDGFSRSVSAFHRSHRRINVFVNRGLLFDGRGRKHTLEESIELDGAIRSILAESADDALFEYYRDDSDLSNYAELLAMVFGMASK